ncbi:MAG: TetR/AcrR family transcriptional regulator [Chloroflexia bacterium]|nr:TetR/AcrR family transcriptional regulator [Chloroflexia bacterium]
MPLQTFQNLDKERQEEIRKVAYREFAMNDYNNASVSNIVKKLNLAKGSFYRYFENKLDLYSYLLEHATQLRMTSINKLVGTEKTDFFKILIENFRDKIEFDIKHPLESVFTYKVLLETNNPEIQHVIVNLKREIFNYVEILLSEFKEKGVIRQDIDIQLTAFSVFQIQVGLFDYLTHYKGVDFIKNIEEGKTVFSIDKDEIMKIVEGMVELLRIGISE